MATLKIDGRAVPLNQGAAADQWKRIVGATTPFINILRRFREEFEVYVEDKGCYARLVGDVRTP